LLIDGHTPDDANTAMVDISAMYLWSQLKKGGVVATHGLDNVLASAVTETELFWYVHAARLQLHGCVGRMRQNPPAAYCSILMVGV
jgi:hypothetical protein